MYSLTYFYLDKADAFQKYEWNLHFKQFTGDFCFAR